jgi:hypothetical protein
MSARSIRGRKQAELKQARVGAAGGQTVMPAPEISGARINNPGASGRFGRQMTVIKPVRKARSHRALQEDRGLQLRSRTRNSAVAWNPQMENFETYAATGARQPPLRRSCRRRALRVYTLPWRTSGILPSCRNLHGFVARIGVDRCAQSRAIIRAPGSGARTFRCPARSALKFQSGKTMFASGESCNGCSI